MTTTPSFSFAPGDWVRLHGLSRSPALNGQLGQVFDGKPEAESGRLAVRVHDELSFRNEDHRLNGLFSMTRHFLQEPTFHSVNMPRTAQEAGCKLLNATNLQRVPKSQMVPAVWYPCQGQAQEGAELFTELLVPRDHPIFSQPANCPVAEVLGIELVQTKLAVHPQRLREEREWCANQPALLTRGDAVSGMSPPDEWDFVGPALLCCRGGVPWTAKEAREFHLFLVDMGDKSDSKAVTLESFGQFARRSDTKAKVARGPVSFWMGERDFPCDDSTKLLFQAAYAGDVAVFGNALKAGTTEGMWRPTKLSEARHHGVSLAEAAAFGGSGEILAALLTHECFDAEAFERTTGIKKVFSFSMRACQGRQRQGDDFEVRKWLLGLLTQLQCARAQLKLPRYTNDGPAQVNPERMPDACALPKSREFELIDFDAIADLDVKDVDHTMAEKYPFPQEALRGWLASPAYREIFSRFGDGEFSKIHCDLRMVEWMYVLALDICSAYEGAESCLQVEDIELTGKAGAAKQLRNVGWNLFFRASKDCMVVHDCCFQRAVCLSNFPGRQARMEAQAMTRVHWDFVGTWVN